MEKRNSFSNCPYCGSEDICRATEHYYKNENSPLIIFVSAFVLLGGYFLFVLYSYLFFPVTALIFAIAASIWINTRDPYKKKKKKKQLTNSETFFCINCEKNFTDQEAGSDDIPLA